MFRNTGLNADRDRYGAPSDLRVSRRALLGGLGAAALCAKPQISWAGRELDALAPTYIDPFFAELQHKTFNFFWETTNRSNGLVRDRYPKKSVASVAAVGFALTTYPIGIERGYVSRDAAIRRVLTTLRFLHDAPQGPDATGMAGYKGFFYHFLDMETGARAGKCELSTVDTALCIAGVLFCQSYFDRDDPAEIEIRQLADAIYNRVDWRWAQFCPPAINHGWMPETGFLDYDWRGYNEATILYVLALGSTTNPCSMDAWSEWTRTFDDCWGANFGYEEHLSFASMFGHQYSHIWIDFRSIRDAYMARRGMDYFVNHRRAVYAQRAYAITNPHGWKDYGPDVWGVSASDGPADVAMEFNGQLRQFRSYAGRGAGYGESAWDDGTLAPTAAVSSIAFAPEIVVPAVLEMKRRYGEHILGEYGFFDSFNPSFDYDVPLTHGRCIPGFGWVADDYLGIDQGPIVTMIENHRSEMVWKVMRKNQHLRRGLMLAGFSGGWLGDAI